MKMPSIQVGLGLSPRSSIQVDFGYPKRNAKGFMERIGDYRRLNLPCAANQIGPRSQRQSPRAENRVIIQ
jgi:hypothetical protein